MFNPEFLATENNDPNEDNDLIQYLSATARDNRSVSYLYHAKYSAFWDLMSKINAHGHRTGREVSICGDIASDTNYLEKLLTYEILFSLCFNFM